MTRNIAKNVRWRAGAAVYILLFSLVSLAFLESFPFVHSDEGWLAGLSRAMMTEGSIGVTEPFFDARPRYPHGVKTIFHLMQMGMIGVFGYGVKSVRLLSWIGGAGVLWMCFLGGTRFLCSEKKGFLFMVVFSLDIQFLYASHFARQEILLCLIQWICIWILLSPKGFYQKKTGVILGICTGISIGFHPNSFLIGTMNGACLLAGAVKAWRRRKNCKKEMEEIETAKETEKETKRAEEVEKTEEIAETEKTEKAEKTGETVAVGKKAGRAEAEEENSWWKPLIFYVAVTACFAAGFIGLSYRLDGHFLKHYFSNGAEEFGIDAGPWEKFLGFFGFLGRLYQRNSGTYYLPDIRFQFFLFGGSLLMAAAVYIILGRELGEAARKIEVLFAGAAGVTVGMMIIGRYNQTGILFLFPFGYMAAALVLELFEGAVKKGLWAFLLAAVLGLSGTQVWRETKKGSYEAYGEQIEQLIPKGARVLGNLNMEFFMDYDCLRDYRNLPYALEEGGLKEYLERNHIEYIVYHQELDYLLEHRPYYNVIYGNVMFVEELKEYCERNCEIIGSFDDPWYGIRVAGLRGQQEYARVVVYRRASSNSSFK